MTVQLENAKIRGRPSQQILLSCRRVLRMHSQRRFHRRCPGIHRTQFTHLLSKEHNSRYKRNRILGGIAIIGVQMIQENKMSNHPKTSAAKSYIRKQWNSRYKSSHKNTKKTSARTQRTRCPSPSVQELKVN